MPQLPRIAVGAVGPDADTAAITCGLLRLLAVDGLQVQHFLSQACFSPRNGAWVASGNGSRHLDTWLMSRQACRETFLRGARDCDFAVVEGRFQTDQDRTASGLAGTGSQMGGSLDTLCDWLHLPRLGVVDLSKLEPCLLPERPGQLDGLFLDKYSDDRHFFHWQATLEALWGVPVLGGLGEFAQLRSRIDQLHHGNSCSAQLCEQLACGLARHTDLVKIRRLAARRPLPTMDTWHSNATASRSRIRIAMAYDDAFNCYFPDTLDQLEALGATVIDFSPLRDERLPDDTDVVYLGCGHPEQQAESLAANQCMMLSIRKHLCAGRRLYGEGGGLAYLCQHIETTDGHRIPMLGILPTVARINPRPLPPRPVELTLARSNWLAEAGATLRGYLNTYWQLEPTSELVRYGSDADQEMDLVGRYHAIGSRLHLNFAAQPDFLRSFIRPHSAGAHSAPV